MIITRVVGNCPSCGGENCYGNVFVRHNRLLRGCRLCNEKEAIPLPNLRKKVIYLDQFFFSGAFRGGEIRFVEAAERIRRLSSLQLLVAPFSSVHEDESHQWRGHEELMAFIRQTSHGHEFKLAEDVDQAQLLKAFQAFLAGRAPDYILDESDAIDSGIHEWDDYVRIEVGRYLGDIDLIRELKQQVADNLFSVFDGWRGLKTSFEEDVALETSAAGKVYLQYFLEFAARIAKGDYNAIFDSPAKSQVVQALWGCTPKNTPPDEQIAIILRFLQSDHFGQAPYQWISARSLGVLKDRVKKGAYTNRKRALSLLTGLSHDLKHIATYAPYCDAFVMDQPMALLIGDSRIRLEERFGVRIFSLRNWDSLFKWLDEIEAGMTQEHKDALRLIYPSPPPETQHTSRV